MRINFGEKFFLYRRHGIELICFVVLCLFSIFSHADDLAPRIVYRAVLEPPNVVKQTNGFLPRGADGTRPDQPPPDISLYNHTMGAETGLARYNSGYVSTTTSLNLAHFWVNSNLGGQGYIYSIHATGNFVDVNSTLGRFSPNPGECEYASLGMIRWNQIVGWYEVSFGVLGDFVRNRDYNERLYNMYHAGGAQPQLSGFPPGHPAWSLDPWIRYSNCSSLRVLSSNVERSCVPKESAQAAGDEFYKRYINMLSMGFVTLMEPVLGGGIFPTSPRL